MCADRNFSPTYEVKSGISSVFVNMARTSSEGQHHWVALKNKVLVSGVGTQSTKYNLYSPKKKKLKII